MAAVWEKGLWAPCSHAPCTLTVVLLWPCSPCSCAPQDFQSKELPTTRIQPDRRWFGNTRVIGQKQLEAFREEMGAKVGG